MTNEASEDYSDIKTAKSKETTEAFQPDDKQYDAEQEVHSFNNNDEEEDEEDDDIDDLDAESQYRRGRMYESGLWCKQSYEKALLYYHKAAEKGSADALSHLGVMYLFGFGVTQDYQKAVEWYRKAAEQGFAQGQAQLGMMYEQGYGVAQSYEKALIWYRRAAEQGYAGAQYLLGVMYANGRGVLQRDGTAVYWFEKAAQQNHNSALVYAVNKGRVPHKILNKRLTGIARLLNKTMLLHKTALVLCTMKDTV